MSRISLNGMEFHAFHGVHDEEREKGNTFLVDINFDANTSQAEQTDAISDTVNYEHLYELVKKEMGTPSKLLEHVGRRIASSIEKGYPEISNLTVTVTKKNPPIKGDVKSVSVTIISSPSS